MATGCGAPLTGKESDSGIDSGLDSGLDFDDAGSSVGTDGGSDAGTSLVDAGSVTPGVPVLTSVTVVTHGTMAVSWQLPASGCTTLALRMRVGAGAYSTVRSLTGAATSTQYSPGHASGTYCFELTCTLQGLESGVSNERCASQ